MKKGLLCGGLAILLSGAFAYRLFSGWQTMRAGEIELRVARTVTRNGGRISATQADAFIAELERAQVMNPVDVSIPIARGSLFFITGRPGPAVAAYEEALAIEPRSEIYRNLGRAYQALGDLRTARPILRTAIELDHKLAPLLRPELHRIDAELERDAAERQERRERREERKRTKKPPA